MSLLISIIMALCDEPMSVPPVTLWEMAYEPGAAEWLQGETP